MIRAQDGPDTLFYLDPPYLPETRADTDTWGEHKMTDDQHKELLETICSLQGKVLLSGYRSTLYDSHLGKWKRHEFELPNNAANGVIKRRMVETVWCNFKRPMRRRGQPDAARRFARWKCALPICGNHQPRCSRQARHSSSKPCRTRRRRTPVGRPSSGPRIGPYDRRSQALDAEIDWLERNWLPMERSC